MQFTEFESKVRQTQNKSFTSKDSYLWQIYGGGHCRNIYYSDFPTWRERVTSTANVFPLPQFSEYPHKSDAQNGKVVNIFQVIDKMTGPQMKAQTNAIRAAATRGDNVEKDRLKSQQPYITHSGIFIPRRNSGLLQPNFCFQLDIDHSNNKSLDIDRTLERIIKDKQLIVLIASKSVSGKGIKALLFLKDLLHIRDSWTAEEYRSTYHQLTDILHRYFIEQHGVVIDTQMKSISQPFYLFYSENLYINKGLR